MIVDRLCKEERPLLTLFDHSSLPSRTSRTQPQQPTYEGSGELIVVGAFDTTYHESFSRAQWHAIFLAFDLPIELPITLSFGISI